MGVRFGGRGATAGCGQTWNAGFRRLVNLLPQDDGERFKPEHLREIEALTTRDNIWFDVGVPCTVGTKPA